MKNRLLKHDLTIPILYLSIGLLWIFYSDKILYSLSTTPSTSEDNMHFFGSVKGYVYVIFTSLLLYILICKKTKILVAVKNDFKRLFEENPNAMWIFDIETFKILLVNEAACKSYGYEKEEFLKLTLFDLRPDYEKEKLMEYFKNPKSKYSDNGEWLHKGKQGNLFFVNIFSHETTYQKTKCRIVTAINIDKKILAEKERENIQQALDNSALVSITNLQGIILEVNDKFCEVSKFNRDELIGKSHNIINSRFHPNDFWVEMWKTISKGISWRADVKNKAKDGTYYWVDTVITPIFDSTGKIYKYMSVRYEITQRKKLEEDQKILLDDLAAYAFQTSHELRGPLARMLGLTSLIDDDYPDHSFIIENMKKTSEEMDVVIRRMNESLNRNSYKLLIEKREQGK
jgi:PAS domain S-box-containing protein